MPYLSGVPESDVCGLPQPTAADRKKKPDRPLNRRRLNDTSCPPMPLQSHARTGTRCTCRGFYGGDNTAAAKSTNIFF